MVRFGFGLLGVHPAGDLVDLVRTADELGFHSCYLPDDPSMRDSWAVVAAAARETSSIRLGFNATHVYLRDPVLIAQALATLDELSDGSRPVVSFGDRRYSRPTISSGAGDVRWRASAKRSR